jgi:hypothetical protein
MSFVGSSVEGWYVVAEDIATLINGEFPSSVSEGMQTALGPVEQWYDRTDLSI